MSKKVILAGGSGFLGQALGRRLRERGHEVVVLTRSHPRRRGDGIREVRWNPTDSAPGNPTGDSTPGDLVRELEGAQAVVNLAGRSIDCVHTAENRRAILETRLVAVRCLGQAMAACAQPPAAWVQASAVGYYGNVPAVRCDETAPAGPDYLAQVCVQGEEALARVCPEAVRPVVLRIGVVLGRKGGAFPPLARMAGRFLGGAAGDGRQGLSWIHQTDMEEIFLRTLEDESMRGPYNACAPEPASNAEFMATLRHLLHRPWAPPAPAFVLRPVARWFLDTDPSLILEGQFALPARLAAAGYQFKFARLELALADLLDRRG